MYSVISFSSPCNRSLEPISFFESNRISQWCHHNQLIPCPGKNQLLNFHISNRHIFKLILHYSTLLLIRLIVIIRFVIYCNLYSVSIIIMCVVNLCILYVTLTGNTIEKTMKINSYFFQMIVNCSKKIVIRSFYNKIYYLLSLALSYIA